MLNKTNFSLTPTDLETFHKLGYIGPFKLYEPNDIQDVWENKLRRELLDTQSAVFHGQEGASGVTNLSNYDRHLDNEFLFNHIKQQAIIERVANILGPDLLCWRSEFFPKYPGDEGTDWHQVSSFSGVTNSKKPHIQWPQNSDFAGTISVWTAFTDANIGNGCLQFIPGTHKQMFYDENKKIHYDPSSINVTEKKARNVAFLVTTMMT